MKTKIMLTLMVTMLMLPIMNVNNAFAEEGSTVVNVGNKRCPVSGQEIGSMGDAYQAEYNGKSYNLCCKMCLKDFEKNPEKYSKIADTEMNEDNDQMHEEHGSGHAHA